MWFLLQNQLWGHVVHCPHFCATFHILFIVVFDLCESEISYFCSPIFYQDILRLNIAVNDSFIKEFASPRDDILYERKSILLFQFPALILDIGVETPGLG